MHAGTLIVGGTATVERKKSQHALIGLRPQNAKREKQTLEALVQRDGTFTKIETAELRDTLLKTCAYVTKP